MSKKSRRHRAKLHRSPDSTTSPAAAPAVAPAPSVSVAPAGRNGWTPAREAAWLAAWQAEQWQEALSVIQPFLDVSERHRLRAAFCLVELKRFNEAAALYAGRDEEQFGPWDWYVLGQCAAKGSPYVWAENPEYRTVLAAYRHAVALPNCPPVAYEALASVLGHERAHREERLAVLSDGVARTNDDTLRLLLARTLTRGEAPDLEAAWNALRPSLIPGEASSAFWWLAFEIAYTRGESDRAVEALPFVEPKRTEDAAVRQLAYGLVYEQIGDRRRAAEAYDQAAEAPEVRGIARMRRLQMDLSQQPTPLKAAEIATALTAALDPLMESRELSDLYWPLILFADAGSTEGLEMPDYDAVWKTVILQRAQYPVPPKTLAHALRWWLMYHQRGPGSDRHVPPKGVAPDLVLRLIQEAATSYCDAWCASTWAEWCAALGDVPSAARFEAFRAVRELRDEWRTDGRPASVVVAEFWFERGPFLSQSVATRRAVHKAFSDALESTFDDDTLAATVFLGLYQYVWRDILLEGPPLLPEFDFLIHALEQLLGESTPAHLALDCAYAADVRGRANEAEQRYRAYLTRHGDQASPLFNLSLLREKARDWREAAALMARAAACVPDDPEYAKRATRLVTVAKVEGAKDAERSAKAAALASRPPTARPATPTLPQPAPTLPPPPLPPPRPDAAGPDDDFLRSAPARWPQLDMYKRRLVATLIVIGGFKNFDELARFADLDPKFVPGHWRKLVANGMIIEPDEGTFRINPYIADLVRREQTHTVATRLIRANGDLAMKPIFNSKLEYRVYALLLEMFPNQLVFPNMGLQTVFQYERMRDLLDEEDFGYFLRAQVDFCITSTTTYFPLICFEVDSAWHDSEDQQVRDEKKDRIFAAGGVPFLRVRPHGRPTPEALRQALVSAIAEAQADIVAASQKAGLAGDEIDFTPFTVQGLPAT